MEYTIYGRLSQLDSILFFVYHIKQNNHALMKTQYVHFLPQGRYRC